MSNFADSRMKVPRYRLSPTSRDHFFFSVYSAAVKCEPKLLPFGVNCRLQLAGLGKKGEKTVKPACFMLKATSVPQAPQTNHPQYSSPVEALNLNVESKSQAVKLGNLTIGLHVPSRRKKSLQSYCSVDFDFLALMRFHMTSSFAKLKNSCN